MCIETRTREALQSYAQLVGNSLPLSMSAPSHVLTAWLPPARYEQLLEHYAYNNELGGTFSTMRTTAMGQARHIRECGFTYDVGQTMAGSRDYQRTGIQSRRRDSGGNRPEWPFPLLGT